MSFAIRRITRAHLGNNALERLALLLARTGVEHIRLMFDFVAYDALPYALFNRLAPLKLFCDTLAGVMGPV